MKISAISNDININIELAPGESPADAARFLNHLAASSGDGAAPPERVVEILRDVPPPVVSVPSIRTPSPPAVQQSMDLEPVKKKKSKHATVSKRKTSAVRLAVLCAVRDGFTTAKDVADLLGRPSANVTGIFTALHGEQRITRRSVAKKPGWCYTYSINPSHPLNRSQLAGLTLDQAIKNYEAGPYRAA